LGGKNAGEKAAVTWKKEKVKDKRSKAKACSSGEREELRSGLVERLLTVKTKKGLIKI